MIWPFKKLPIKSIRFKIILGILSILIPLILFVVYINFYAIRVIHEQVFRGYKNVLTLYTQQVDRSLSAADNYFYQLIAQDAFFEKMNSYDVDHFVLERINLAKKFENDLVVHSSLDGIFYYSTKNHALISGYNTNYFGSKRDVIINSLENYLQTDPAVSYTANKGWLFYDVNGQTYILRLFKVYGDYVGAWIYPENLLKEIGSIDLGPNGTAVIASHGISLASSRPITDDKIDLSQNFDQYYLSGSNAQTLIVGAAAAKGDFSLVALIPEREILVNFILLRRIIQLLAWGSILLIPFMYYFINRVIIRPFNSIIHDMKIIQDGNIDRRIESNNNMADEFRNFSFGFNNMLDQIHDLKIRVYEEKIISQKEELERLKLQINPHFFLNSLNTIYRLTQTRRYDLVQEMSRCLIDYFRFSIRNSENFVSLKDEVNHVSNFLRIHEMRFPPNTFIYEITVPEVLYSIPVPALFIQNFVENSIKYAVSLDEPVKITLLVELVEQDNIPFMKVIIHDTGPGFPENILEEFQHATTLNSENRSKIGIKNVLRRLQLLYGDRAHIEFENILPHGAEVRIFLPVTKDSR